MRQTNEFRPTPALTVATVALVVAFGGVAWATIPDAAAAVGLGQVGVASSAQSRVTVAGTAAPGQAGSSRIGDAASAQRISFAVTLPLRNRAELSSVIASVSDPLSPEYGHYLSSAQFAARFGPTEAQVQSVTGYLRSQGITVSGVTSNHTIIDASGSVAKAEQALGTGLGRYHDPRLRRDYIANDAAVSLPQPVAREVLGIVGLDTHFMRSHPPVPAANPLASAGPAGGYTPAQLKSAYDFGPLTSAGFNGSGQNVGLFELDGFQQSNISTYDTQYGLGSPAPTIRTVDGGSSVLGAGQTEVELDIELIHAIAPAANVTVFEGPNTDAGVIDTYNAMATANITPSNSTSWGMCELQSSSATIASESNIFAQMAAQGMSLFARSGDSGAYDCGASGQLAVDNPADDPNVTGTGGTSLTLGASNAYAGEHAWGGSPSEGGGGGVSTIFAKPAWQTAPGMPSNCATKRCVPDVSSDADPYTGYSIFSQGSWTVVGGTSAAAPMWAGFTAVYNQDAVTSGKPRLGFANPALYRLASATQTAAPFHDVMRGYTSTSDNWPAHAGYDLATGLGTYDATNIVTDRIGPTTTNDFSISASPASVSVAQGASGSSTISTAVTSGSAQTVSLSASGLPSGSSPSFNRSSITAGGAATLTINLSSAAPAGTYTITVTGTGTTTIHSTTVALTVTSAGSGSGIDDGGFETGTLSGWTTSGAASSVVSSGCHTGSYCAQLGSTSPTNGDSSIAQTFIVPWGSNQLSFYYKVVCPDTVTYDWATATLKDNTARTTTTVLPKTCTSPASAWTSASAAVTSGHSYTLTLTNHDDNYSADPTNTLYDDVALSGDFSISASPSSLTVQPGSSASSTISTAVTRGSAQTVSLSASGAPSGATTSLNPTSLTAGRVSTLTITLSATTPAGSYTIAVTGTSTSHTHSTTVALTVPGITNGGFETGTLAGWTPSGAASSVVNSGCHSGSDCAQLGSTSPTNGDSSITQTFTAPSATTKLTFYYKAVCPDTLTYDWATATLKDNTAGTTTTVLPRTCPYPGAWTAASSTVTAGHSYTLTLTSHDDNYPGDATYTLYDEVVLS